MRITSKIYVSCIRHKVKRLNITASMRFYAEGECCFVICVLKVRQNMLWSFSRYRKGQSDLIKDTPVTPAQ